MKRKRTRKHTKSSGFISLLLTIVLLISGCTHPSDMAGEGGTTVPEATTTATEATTTETATTTARPDGLEKLICTATLEDDFDADKVLIMVFPEYNYVSYTVSDFAEIECIKIEDLSVKITDGKVSRIMALFLADESKENVLDAIRMLETRDDIYCAEPSYTHYPCEITEIETNAIAYQWPIIEIQHYPRRITPSGVDCFLRLCYNRNRKILEKSSPDVTNRAFSIGYG